MWVIAKSHLRRFWESRKDDSDIAQKDLVTWFKLAETADWANFWALKQTFGSADQVGNCVVLDVCRVEIGDFTLFGQAVQIYTATHPMNAELRRKQEFAKPIKIGADVWVGGGAIFCPGVTIGSKSVIGAGSVVTRDIPDGVFAAGNPCRVIRQITE